MKQKILAYNLKVIETCSYRTVLRINSCGVSHTKKELDIVRGLLIAEIEKEKKNGTHR